MKLTKRMAGHIAEIDRQMHANAELAELHMRPGSYEDAARLYSMACAFAIALKEIYLGLGDEQMAYEYQDNYQGRFARLASDAEQNWRRP